MRQTKELWGGDEIVENMNANMRLQKITQEPQTNEEGGAR